MRNYLSKDAYKSVLASIRDGKKIERSMSDQVASAMKAWAIDKGATHHTHWFQPLTGATAEKHDTFFNPISESKGIESFSGDQLVQGEPDGSSFPSGGLRDTHEARGYTAWDPSSPAFIMEVGIQGKTLCIPTIFISYTGASMGYKTPLLKSKQFLENAALPVVQMFERNVKKVFPTLGWEQEYFLVDEAMYNARPDLVACGRTLLGRNPAKGQQLDDHYFGSIPERVYAFMLELETEALKLGIPISTRHNEVAPGQYEFAPVFDEVNRAVDQNTLLMDLMERVSRRHRFRVLMHEKPFAEFNGSGKHNNFSLGTDTGINLLKPGSTPRKNLMFLTFFVNVIQAVNNYSDLVRATIASPGNDHRLGGHEAPPAIISIFIGSALTKVLEEVEKQVKEGGMDELDRMDIKLNIHNLIPELLLDNTDRNRTSPFAFTGNKFEIRAVGSSANCAFPMTVMNTILGYQLTEFKKEVEKLIDSKSEKKEGAILNVLRKYIKKSKRILFEGDNYSAEWVKEAEKRGLSNVKTTPDALDFLVTKEAKKVFTAGDIFSEAELEARYEVLQEGYQKKIQIEARILGEMVVNQITPAAISYMNRITKNIEGLKSAGFGKEMLVTQKHILGLVAERINTSNALVIEMINARAECNKIEDTAKKAKAYQEKVFPYLFKVRKIVDKLELVMDDDLWPLPKYRELLFLK
ncbi:UNVERIFIED_CONTAM: hypothetical protein GTU68_023183 [Idotea baltica]|nr:hypothetical protein [Idotea baltica]